MSSQRRIEPLEIHTTEYEHPTEDIINEEEQLDDKDDDWCNNNGVDEMNKLLSH